jgi:membrane protein insertase Oxa1/YidC/SpoIIIJ
MSKFDHSLFGVVDLSRMGLDQGSIYFPALIIAILAAIAQFYQSKMLLPDSKDSKKLMQILRDASSGQEADQSEVSAAVSRSMMYFLPFFTFIFALVVPSALALYLLTSASIGYVQQYYVLNQDKDELEKISETPVSDEKETSPARKSARKKSAKKKKTKKRR